MVLNGCETYHGGKEREQLSKQALLSAEKAAAGVAVADDCQHKSRLRARVWRDARLARFQIPYEVVVPPVLHQVSLQQRNLLYHKTDNQS